VDEQVTFHYNETAVSTRELADAGDSQAMSKSRSFLNFPRKSSEVEELRAEVARLNRAVGELTILNDLAFAMGGTAEPDEIIKTLVDRLMRAVSAEQAVVTLLDQDERDPMKTSLRLRATSGVDSVFRLSDSLLGWMYLHKQALVVNDPKNDERFKRVKWDDSIRSLMCVPLMVKSNLTGLMTLYNKKRAPGFSDDDQRLLTIIAAQSANLIDNARLYQESLKLAQVQQEQKNAYEIQRNLLPRSQPDVIGYDIAGTSAPARVVGGDYFDFIRTKGDRWAICLGDVSGKGTPAALLMANLQATLRSQTLSEIPVDELVNRSNRLMCQSMDSERFVTLFFAELDPTSHEVSYCNAGHEQPLLVSGDALSRLETTGVAVGVISNHVYQKREFALKPGDLVVIYTDGVTDAVNARHEAFGLPRLEATIKAHRNEPAKTLIESIVKAVHGHAGGEPQYDDLTLVAIRRSA
jgi:serine phosphatase RsbU (regulator of sigma subunit)